MDEKILYLTRLGMSERYISEQLGCSLYYIRKIRKANGLCKVHYGDCKYPELKFPATLLAEWDEVTTNLRRLCKCKK